MTLDIYPHECNDTQPDALAIQMCPIWRYGIDVQE
jgi:hypothetical protein